MRVSLLAIALCALPAFAQPPAAPAKPAAPARVVPPARIRDFKADPASLQPGQATTITWNVENPNSTNISGFGNVTATGSRRVTPTATTTYTLTVTGPNNQTETRKLTVTVAGTKAVDAATVSQTTKPTPRLSNGKPDLTGVYNPASFSQMFGGRVTRGQNDPITAKLKPGAEKYKVVRGPEDTGQFSDCMPTAVPNSYFVPYQWQIVASNNYVVIMYEYPHLFRAIPIASANNPAEHPADPDPTWMGNSVARWEGDTLVVDVIGFNDKTELPGGYKHSESLHVVERFRRTSYDDLDYEATIEDPNVFAEPWTIKRGFPLRDDLQTVNEFVCENNRDYKGFFGKK